MNKSYGETLSAFGKKKLAEKIWSRFVMAWPTSQQYSISGENE